MNLPWIELKRRPGRFATATVVLSLLAALLMLLGGLLDGLLNGATSGIKGLNADVLVYSSSAQSSFPRSRIEAATREQAVKADGVDAGALQLLHPHLVKLAAINHLKDFQRAAICAAALITQTMSESSSTRPFSGTK